MINFDEYTNENTIKYNPNWPYIPDHLYRILIIGGTGTGKTNALLNLINNQPDIDKIYLYAKESVDINRLNYRKTFIEYFNNMDKVYKNIDNYNPNKENKILIVFDDMIADTINDKKLNSTVTDLFIRGRKLNISLVFIT